jgi:hypothetical protein
MVGTGLDGLAVKVKVAGAGLSPALKNRVRRAVLPDVDDRTQPPVMLTLLIVVALIVTCSVAVAATLLVSRTVTGAVNMWLWPPPVRVAVGVVEPKVKLAADAAKAGTAEAIVITGTAQATLPAVDRTLRRLMGPEVRECSSVESLTVGRSYVSAVTAGGTQSATLVGQNRYMHVNSFTSPDLPQKWSIQAMEGTSPKWPFVVSGEPTRQYDPPVAGTVGTTPTHCAVQFAPVRGTD